MSRKLFLLCLLVIGLLPLVKAQIGAPIRVGKNVFYAEWYGNGIYYSLNYEKMFCRKVKIQKCARIGAMTYPSILGKNGWVFAFPVEMNVLFGSQRNKIEVGVGHTFTTGKFHHMASHKTRGYIMNHYKQHLLVARVGYRIYSKSGIVFRVGVLPLVVYKPGYIRETQESPVFGVIRKRPATFDVGASLGLSFGYAF